MPATCKSFASRSATSIACDTVKAFCEETFPKLWGKEHLSQLQSSKRTYTGQNISVIVSTMVKVQSSGQVEHLPLLVVGGYGPGLLGRDHYLLS